MARHLASVVRSAIDLRLYREVLGERSRRTAGFVALTSILVGIATAVVLTLSLREAIVRHVLPEVRSWPVVTIERGVASANVPQPWARRLRDAASGHTIALVVDTTGSTVDLRPGEVGLLLRRNDVVLRAEPAGEPRVVSLARVRHVVIDPPRLVERLLRTGLLYVLGALALLAPLVVAARTLLRALLLTVVAAVASVGRRRAFRFGELYRLALYAGTPALLFDVACLAGAIAPPHRLALSLILAATYTVLAVRAVPDEPTGAGR